jgi:hypothetical protein
VRVTENLKVRLRKLLTQRRNRRQRQNEVPDRSSTNYKDLTELRIHFMPVDLKLEFRKAQNRDKQSEDERNAADNLEPFF